MLKTNTKKARQNVQNYIINNFDIEFSTIQGIDESNFSEVASAIYKTFVEQVNGDNRKMAIADRFEEWAAGLPSVIDTCYYYNRSAVDDLAEILEETTEEKTKYDESSAEHLLTYLIFREIEKEANK